MAAQRENHLDNIFHALGELKTFTICQVLVMSLISFPAAYQLLSNVFIGWTIPHRCASAPVNDSSIILQGLEEYQDVNLTISYQECQIVVSYNNSTLKTEACIYGMSYEGPRDKSFVAQPFTMTYMTPLADSRREHLGHDLQHLKRDYNFSDKGNAVFNWPGQFDLVCDYKSLARLSQTLVIVGQGIGATFFTIVSDRLGRKPVLVISNIGLLVSGLIIAFAPNFTIFAICKFFAGTFQQAFCGGMVWGFSTMSLAPWAYFLRHYSWRTLQMVLSLTSLTFVIQFWYQRESLRWLIANGKSKAIVSYVRCATNLNKTSFEKTMQAYEESCRLTDEEVEGSLETYSKGTATRKLTLVDLLKVKRLLLNAVILWLAWFTTALNYFTTYLTATSLAGDPYLNYFLTSLMEIPNNFIFYLFLNRYGRKFTFIAIYFIISFGLIGGGIFRSLEENTLNSVFALIFSCISMTGASAGFNFVFFYTPEIFPTNMRNQAVGVSSLMGRVGGMIAPFTGVLSEKAKWAPGVMIGCCAFVVCLSSSLLPETRGRELPQTIEDVKAWFVTKDKRERKAEEQGDNLDTVN